MDHFGIGVGIRGAVLTYLQAARRTGRTTSLVESVKTGDRVVFTGSLEASRVQRLCAERGVAVECIVIDPREPQRLMERGTPEGRTIFDHTWVEQYYLEHLHQCRRIIDDLERETSGYGVAHRKTRHYFEEIARWPG